MKVQACIAGGGPAGMMLGLLLARAGVKVLVLEKHADFLRDFRGDTLHPSTLEVMHELGLLDALLLRPHQKVPSLVAQFDDQPFALADFGHLPTRCRFIAMMPQWDFLDFLARHAARLPCFELRMNAEAVGVVERDGRIGGVRALTPRGMLEVEADLTVAADGRQSSLRAQAGLEVQDLGAPMDVLWFRLSRRPGDPENSMGRFGAGRIFIMIARGDYWQCGFVISKGAADRVRAAGLPAFHAAIARLAPFASRLAEDLPDWDAVKLLSVRVDRLKQWHRPGLLCIGDAAHAMSPVGGVGINLAVQDAVAAANLLARPLREGRVSARNLAAFQSRREWPVRVTQRLQLLVQNRLIARILDSGKRPAPPIVMRLLARFPALRRIPGRLIGLGVRPEHVRTTEAVPERARRGTTE